MLSGSNTYSGGTVVEAGSLVIANAYSVESGTNLIVGNPSKFTAAIPAAVATADTPTSPVPVPEPGTFLLLTVGAGLLASIRSRPRGKEKTLPRDRDPRHRLTMVFARLAISRIRTVLECGRNYSSGSSRTGVQASR